MKYTVILSFFLFLCLSNIEVDAQQRRIALVIGNGDYSHSGKLKNPVNDAEVMASTLESLDFKVIKEINADKEKMELSIYEFSKKLNEYNVALFYYAGHGIQVGGRNFLLPTDAVLEDKIAAEFEAIDVNKVVSQFERHPNNTNIVILDACRNNPFKSFSRGGETGFSAIPAPSGTIIAFATGEGSTASDGLGDNGLYTSVLSDEMKKPQRIEDVFINTRIKVRQISNAEQSPQEWSQLTGKFYFATDGNSNANSSNTSTNISLSSSPEVKETQTGGKPSLDRGKISAGGYEAKSHMADLLQKGYTIKDIFELGIPARFLFGIEFKGGIIAAFNEDKTECTLVATNDQSRGVAIDWEEAAAMCNFYQVGEYVGWRLPSKAELLTIYENLQVGEYGDFLSKSYWTSTLSGYNNAWGVSFSSGRSYDFDKKSSHHVRAVRTIPIK